MFISAFWFSLSGVVLFISPFDFGRAKCENLNMSSFLWHWVYHPRDIASNFV